MNTKKQLKIPYENVMKRIYMTSVDKKVQFCMDNISESEFKEKIKNGVSLDEIFYEIHKTTTSAELFYDDKKFMHNIFGDHLRYKYHIKKINNAIHYYDEKNGKYNICNKIEINRLIIADIPYLNGKQRSEVINYLNAVCNDDVYTEEKPTLINFKNGYLDIIKNEMHEHTPDKIFTYCIPHNYKSTVPKNQTAEYFFDSVSCSHRRFELLMV